MLKNIYFENHELFIIINYLTYDLKHAFVFVKKEYNITSKIEKVYHFFE